MVHFIKILILVVFVFITETQLFSQSKVYYVRVKGDTVEPVALLKIDSTGTMPIPPEYSAYVWYGGIGKWYIRYSNGTIHNLDSSGSTIDTSTYGTGLATLYRLGLKLSSADSGSGVNYTTNKRLRDSLLTFFHKADSTVGGYGTYSADQQRLLKGDSVSGINYTTNKRLRDSLGTMWHKGDSTVGGYASFANSNSKIPKGDSVTGVWYVTLKRMIDSLANVIHKATPVAWDTAPGASRAGINNRGQGRFGLTTHSSTNHGLAIGGEIVGQPGTVGFTDFQLWKDATPTRAVCIGLSVPGTAATNDIVLSTYTGSAWYGAMSIPNGAVSEGYTPIVIDTVERTNQSASISGTNVTNFGTGTHYYRCTYYIGCTAVDAGAPTVTFYFSGFETTAKTMTSATVTLNSIANCTSGTFYVKNASASANLQWSTAVGGTIGTAKYTISAVFERIN